MASPMAKKHYMPCKKQGQQQTEHCRWITKKWTHTQQVSIIEKEGAYMKMLEINSCYSVGQTL